MNKSLPPSRVRVLQEPSIMHQKVSSIFMQKTVAPNAQLTAPLSRLATDGTFNHNDRGAHLVR